MTILTTIECIPAGATLLHGNAGSIVYELNGKRSAMAVVKVEKGKKNSGPEGPDMNVIRF